MPGYPILLPKYDRGSEESVKILAEQLVKRGNNVIVLSFDLDKKLKNSEIINGVRLFVTKTFTKEGLLLNLALMCQSLKNMKQQ